MRTVVVTGSHGLIGSALVPALEAGGARVIPLVRAAGAPRPGALSWDPSRGRLDPGGLEGVDAVVHLGGENIAAGRWTADRKTRIRRSRIEGTALLARTLAGPGTRPRVFVCASATGYYGDRGDEVLDEESPPGTGFLADVCREWEAAADPARAAGVRVVHLRTGTVLSRTGGALGQLLPVFRMGAGGPLGSGRQYMSWIALADAVAVIQHLLAHEEIAGPVNVVAPHPVTNREFTRALGRVLHRPTLVSVPAAALRMLFGELADSALLASARVEPVRLLRSGYAFRLPEIEGALRALVSPGARS